MEIPLCTSRLGLLIEPLVRLSPWVTADSKILLLVGDGLMDFAIGLLRISGLCDLFVTGPPTHDTHVVFLYSCIYLKILLQQQYIFKLTDILQLYLVIRLSLSVSLLACSLLYPYERELLGSSQVVG